MNYFKHKMRSKNPAAIVGWVLLAILGIGALLLLFGFLIMNLWNALMPAIFGLPLITYWQAMGLCLLSKILFGGFGGGSGNKRQSKNDTKCLNKESKNDFSKWKLYDKFWEEEGDAAYQDFINRKKSLDAEGEQ